MPRISRWIVAAVFAGLMTAAAFQQAWPELWPPQFAAQLEIVTEPRMPARIYAWKGNQEFRLTPTDAVMPLRTDTFYRDRFVSHVPDPKTMEVVARDKFHYLLLKGQATFYLPPGDYRLQAYRGLFYTPAEESFTLKPNEKRRVVLKLKPWEGVDPKQWITSDDHIHLTRSKREEPVLLDWLAAEDLNVGNFLSLQRQMDAAVQYGFGKAGEGRKPGYVIRSGQELRNEFWGHTNILGARELIRPMSTGMMYANTPESWPIPAQWFAQGRKLGGLTGYAHFFQKPNHSTLYFDAVEGNIDFAEVFQFGVLKQTEWYELLNAGLKITGVAGSDFPVDLLRKDKWPKWTPMLGPERAMVKAQAGEGVYEAWARGVKEGRVVVSNGPVVELKVDQATGRAEATAAFWRPLESLEIVRNGEVIARAAGDGALTRLTVTGTAALTESCWLAARVKAKTLPDEPQIQAHTNPTWLLKDGRPVRVASARRTLAAKWEEELAYFRQANIVFPGEAQKKEFFDRAERVLAELRKVD